MPWGGAEGSAHDETHSPHAVNAASTFAAVWGNEIPFFMRDDEGAVAERHETGEPLVALDRPVRHVGAVDHKAVAPFSTRVASGAMVLTNHLKGAIG